MELIENNKDALFKIDLEHIGFFKPQELAAIRCYLDLIRDEEKSTFDIIPPSLDDAKNYSGRNGAVRRNKLYISL